MNDDTPPRFARRPRRNPAERRVSSEKGGGAGLETAAPNVSQRPARAGRPDRPSAFDQPEPAPGRAPREPGQDGVLIPGGLRGLFWREILPELLQRLGRDPASQPTSTEWRDWDLVLTARGIPHRLERRRGSERTDHADRDEAFSLTAPARFTQAALHEIASFVAENRAFGAPYQPPHFFPNTAATLWVLLGLIVFHGVTARSIDLFSASGQLLDWALAGSANARAILQDGQWQRLVTALTLHADAAHLAANVFIGGWFFLLLCRELGSGLGWAVILSAGALGNAVNTLAHGPGHNSLGASTAVFGAVGALAALRAVRGQVEGLKRALVPVAGGLTLLVFLGSEGERTDVGAHLFGFAAGLFLGLGVGLGVNRFGLPGRWGNRILALADLAAPVAAWAMVLA